MSTTMKAFRARPHTRRPGFLGDDLARQLLEAAIAGAERTKPAWVGYGGAAVVRPDVRIAETIGGLADWRDFLCQRIGAILPALAHDLGMTPFQPADAQISILAYRDGAFYRRHLDVQTGAERPELARKLTCAYYFHRDPMGFTGGALRLHSVAGDELTDVAPEHDLLVAFPAWLPHEVLPTVVPSGTFADSRFAAIAFFC